MLQCSAYVWIVMDFGIIRRKRKIFPDTWCIRVSILPVEMGVRGYNEYTECSLTAITVIPSSKMIF